MLPILTHWRASRYILLVWSDAAFHFCKSKDNACIKYTAQDSIFASSSSEDVYAILPFKAGKTTFCPLAAAVYGSNTPVLLYNMTKCAVSLSALIKGVDEKACVFSLNQPEKITLANAGASTSQQNFIPLTFGLQAVHGMMGMCGDETALNKMLERTRLSAKEEEACVVVYPNEYDMDLGFDA